MARTLQPELMAFFFFTVALNLRDLSRINRWFGGNRALANVLDPHLRRNPEALVFGCWGGQWKTLRWLSARYPRARFLALDRAERLLQLGSGPRVAADVFAWPVRAKSVDIVLCSLFLHHFTDAEIGQILANFQAAARQTVVAVDLHRHPLSRGFLPSPGGLASGDGARRGDQRGCRVYTVRVAGVGAARACSISLAVVSAIA